jgi:putative transposase
MNIIEKPPDWFNSEIEKQISLPSNKDNKNKTNIVNFGNGEKISISKFKTAIINKFDFVKLEHVDVDKETKKLKAILVKSVATINKNNKANKVQSIKHMTTKTNKKIENMNKTTICKQYKIYPTKKQIKTIHNWFAECTKVYNKCCDMYKKNNEIFNDPYTTVKLIVFKSLYGDNKKNAPYDTLTDEVRAFCSNLKSAKTNLAKRNIDKFELKHKNIESSQCLFLPKTSIRDGSFYKREIGDVIGMEDIDEVENDCRLIHDKILNCYNLLIPTKINIKHIVNKKPIVALDPGEKIFMSYYSLNGYGHLGKDMRISILKERDKISKLQRTIKNKTNKKGEIIRNRNIKNLRTKINKCYRKIQNIRKELHNKTALYLCKNYERILIPEFRTQNMVRNGENIKKKGKEIIKTKEQLKLYDKTKRLKKSVKFVLNSLAHYKFREHLKNKAIEYGSKIVVVTEEYTSQACSSCGHRSTKYNKREKECLKCKIKIDRDINGSRNILIKNIQVELKGRKSVGI